MKIIWLEDAPRTINNAISKIRKHATNIAEIEICECFADFSQALYELSDSKENIIIIDIRMLFNIEHEFHCFENNFHVNEELDAGFEYYKECLEGKFSKAKIVFFTSKPYDEAKFDAKKYGIDVDMLITKDDISKLIKFLGDK